MNDDEIRRSIRHAAQLHGVSPGAVVAEVEDKGGDPEPARGGWPRRVAWFASLVTVGVVLGALGIGVFKLVSDPVETQGATLQDTKESVAPAPSTAQISQLGGLDFNFSYPSEFNQVAQVKSGGPMIEQYTLTSKSDYQLQVSVSLRPLTSGQLGDDSSWRVRQLKPDEYTQKKEPASGKDVVGVMTKADKTEQSLFWVHKGKLLIVSVTSSNPNKDVAAILNVIKGSMRWKQ